jgi:hypothetical protein
MGVPPSIWLALSATTPAESAAARFGDIHATGTSGAETTSRRRRGLILPIQAATHRPHQAPQGRREKQKMDNLIARVASAAGVTPEVARQATGLVVDFIQREAPKEAVDKLMEKAPALNAIIASLPGAGGEGMSTGLKGLMGIAAGAMGGGGLMALGGQLMGLGLDMGQIQTVGKEIFAYAREVAGDDVVGEIAGAIPGLSQFI